MSYVQVAEPMQQEGNFADMQLLQTSLPHACDDNAVSNLQHYGSYMVVGPSQPASAMHNSYSLADHTGTAHNHTQSVNHPHPALHNSYSIADNTGTANHHTHSVKHANPALQNSYSPVSNSDAADDHAADVSEPMTGMTGDADVWYGAHPTDAAEQAALHSQNSAAGIASGYGQQLVHYTAGGKKSMPGDVSRHDTPTSVFDIFNSLSIMPPSPTGQNGHFPNGEGLLCMPTAYYGIAASLLSQVQDSRSSTVIWSNQPLVSLEFTRKASPDWLTLMWSQ